MRCFCEQGLKIGEKSVKDQVVLSAYFAHILRTS